MASDAGFVQFVVDQISGAGEITSRKMFGDYALYCNKKVVGLICDNKLYVKPTENGGKYAGDVALAPAFPGAKPSFLIEDKLEDRKWLTELIRITERQLPEPKPKKKSATRTSHKAKGKRS
jgi:TfoX/Sxy family transcriptional regulator of competence genes